MSPTAHCAPEGLNDFEQHIGSRLWSSSVTCHKPLAGRRTRTRTSSTETGKETCAGHGACTLLSEDGESLESLESVALSVGLWDDELGSGRRSTPRPQLWELLASSRRRGTCESTPRSFSKQGFSSCFSRWCRAAKHRRLTLAADSSLSEEYRTFNGSRCPSCQSPKQFLSASLKFKVSATDGRNRRKLYVEYWSDSLSARDRRGRRKSERANS